MSKPPNILCIMSDEHDRAVAGCYGDSLVETPHLDALAARGVTFDACYCNSPLCVPSRQSFTAGRYVSRIGTWQNSAALPAETASLPRLLRGVGYQPFLCGKQHYHAERRYGFIDLIPEHNRHRLDGRGRHRGVHDPVDEVSWYERAADFHPGYRSSVMDHDRQVTATASVFLHEWDPAQGPFFLFTGYVAPHFPLIAPPALWRKYQGRIAMPELPADFPDCLPTNYRQHRLGFGSVLADDATVRRGRELYWALTEWFDGQIGSLLGSLADSRVVEDTVVIYTSDHGENKGDHGLWWKNCLYEHGAGVPLIVSWPARWAGGQRRSQVCSLVDLVQTIAALAGADCPADWDGDSLLPLLDDAATPWKDTALSEYYGHNVCSGITMWRAGRWKYVYHSRIDAEHGPERELYDLLADPKELRNLATTSGQAERITAMHAAMLMELGADPDVIEQRCRGDLAAGSAE